MNRNYRVSRLLLQLFLFLTLLPAASANNDTHPPPVNITTHVRTTTPHSLPPTHKPVDVGSATPPPAKYDSSTHAVKGTSLCSTVQTASRSSGSSPGQDLIELHIVGLFGITGPYPVGTAFQLAAELAEEDINNREDVLPGYRLVLESVNTECHIATGMDLLYQKLYDTTSTKIMVLGGTCSDTTEQTAQASFKHNMVQISNSAVSPRLTRKNYEWFFRMLAPESELSYARLALFQKYNWTTVTIVQASQHLFSATVEVMRNILLRNNMTINDTLPFDNDPEKAILELKKNDARIILFASYENQARNACCQAYRHKFYGKKIVWIFPGFFDLKWYDYDDYNCTAKQKLEVIDGYFTASNVNLAEEGEGETVGANATEYHDRFSCKALRHLAATNRTVYEQTLKNRTEEEFVRSQDYDIIVSGQSRAPLAYDAMWAIALALNATLTHLINNGSELDVLKHFSYDNEEMGKLIFEKMNKTMFHGLSGDVSFTASGARIPQIVIKQFQVEKNLDSAGFKVVGRYKKSSETVWNDTAVRWKGHGPPFSTRRTMGKIQPLSWKLYASMCFLASVGVTLSVAFLIFNVRYRNVRLIKMSSPKINNLILIGCILVYCTVTTGNIHQYQLNGLCHVRLYLMALGFSLGYGALFAKTWRVYEIMTAGSRLLNTRALRDSSLFMTVLVLVAVNLGVLVVWTAVDTMTMIPVNIDDAEKVRDDDIIEIAQTLECQSNHKMQFTLGLLCLQALLILFGAFLALQTRKVSIPELNDSRWVGLCIYNVVVLGSLGAILVLGTRQPPDVAYLLESVIVIVGTTLTQCLVFVPKLLALRQMKQGRKGSQQKTLIVKTLCVGPTSSSSLQSPDNGDDIKPDSPKHRSASSSPCKKTLGKASRKLSTVLKRCYSGKSNSHGQMDQKLEKETVSDVVQVSLSNMVSRAISACDLQVGFEEQQSNCSSCVRGLIPPTGFIHSCLKLGSPCKGQSQWTDSALTRMQVSTGEKVLHGDAGCGSQARSLYPRGFNTCCIRSYGCRCCYHLNGVLGGGDRRPVRRSSFGGVQKYHVDCGRVTLSCLPTVWQQDKLSDSNTRPQFSVDSGLDEMQIPAQNFGHQNYLCLSPRSFLRGSLAEQSQGRLRASLSESQLCQTASQVCANHLVMAGPGGWVSEEHRLQPHQETVGREYIKYTSEEEWVPPDGLPKLLRSTSFAQLPGEGDSRAPRQRHLSADACSFRQPCPVSDFLALEMPLGMASDSTAACSRRCVESPTAFENRAVATVGRSECTDNELTAQRNISTPC